jgi:metal-responsive CopG/Arc/MetJ family transcriptional regulator
MSYAKVTITVNDQDLAAADVMVAQEKYQSRSHFFQVSAKKEIKEQKKNTLAVACSFLDVEAEQKMAEEDFVNEITPWGNF